MLRTVCCELRAIAPHGLAAQVGTHPRLPRAAVPRPASTRRWCCSDAALLALQRVASRWPTRCCDTNRIFFDFSLTTSVRRTSELSFPPIDRQADIARMLDGRGCRDKVHSAIDAWWARYRSSVQAAANQYRYPSFDVQTGSLVWCQRVADGCLRTRRGGARLLVSGAPNWTERQRCSYVPIA